MTFRVHLWTTLILIFYKQVYPFKKNIIIRYTAHGLKLGLFLKTYTIIRYPL